MNKVFVLVDWQVDFVDAENGVMGFERAKGMDEGIVKKLIEYDSDGGVIITTHDTSIPGEYEETTEGKALGIHTVPGTTGYALYGKAGKMVADLNVIDIQKITFPSLELAGILKTLDSKFMEETGKGIEQVEFAGVDAAICVTSNIVIAIAALPKAKIVVDSHLIDSYDAEAKEAALKVLKMMLVEVR